MGSIIQFFINKRLFADLLTVFIVIVGIASLFLVKREVFPNVQFDIITVTTLYPGASPEEVEKLLTNPIELDMKDVDGIKKLMSSSTENRSYIIAQLDPDQTTEAKAKEDIKTVIDLFEKPEDAEDPRVIALETKQQPIIEITMSAEMPELELRRLARDLENRLEALPGVAKIAFKGLRDLEIRIEADPRKLVRHGVSLDEMINALNLQNKSIPAGTIEPPPGSERFEKIVRTIGQFQTPEEVGQTVVRANEMGLVIRVGDLAKISYDLKKAEVLNRANGQPAIGLTVLKKESADAIRVVEQVRQEVTAFQEQLQKPVGLSFINDFSELIKRRLSILSSNLVVGVFLVFVTLALFLPMKIAMIVAAGITIAFFGTIAVFHNMGYSLNLISLLGFIIVCGMLVDDAVVVSDNITRYLQKGLSPVDAAVRGTREVWPAITASVMTTMVAFLPMMFMSGIFGKFVKQIPVGVVIALLLSLVESIAILPQHMASFIKLADLSSERTRRPSVRNIRLGFAGWWDRVVAPNYARVVAVILRRRYWAAAGLMGFVIFTGLAASVGLKFVLFPPEGVEAFFVRVKAPTGYSLNQTTQLVEPVEKILMDLPRHELKDIITTVGLVQQDPNDPNTQRGSEYAQIAVYLSPEEQRERTAQEIIEEMRKKIGLPQGLERITFDRVQPGPPMGKAISIGVRGATYEEILPAVAALKERIKEINGVKDISDSYVQGKEEVRVIINRAAAAAAGLSVAQVGSTVRAAVDGIVATTVRELDEKIDVRVTFDRSSKTDAAVLEKVEILNPRGILVPLRKIATFERDRGIAVYTHEGNRREVKVTADVDTNISSSSEANNLIRRDILPMFQTEFPTVQVGFGGEDEDTQESLASLGRSFLVAFMAVFLILVLTFGNLYQPFLIMLTIPLGVLSVIWAFMLLRLPLSFMGMLGVVALSGVIVNNAIILIDFVNQSREQGMDRFESILEATKIRLRPIFLTTVSTVMGLLPTAHGIGGIDRFVMPIAVALGYGLMVGSLLTLFFFPAAIAILDDVAAWFGGFRKKSGSGPSAPA